MSDKSNIDYDAIINGLHAKAKREYEDSVKVKERMRKAKVQRVNRILEEAIRKYQYVSKKQKLYNKIKVYFVDFVCYIHLANRGLK